MKKVLTIAGSDCSGGAGIQAHLKTIAAHKLYGMSVITALTAQNTTGVYGVAETSPDFVAAQLDAVFTDIGPDAVKIGMVSSPAIIEAIAERLSFYKAKRFCQIKLVYNALRSVFSSYNLQSFIRKSLWVYANSSYVIVL